MINVDDFLNSPVDENTEESFVGNVLDTLGYLGRPSEAIAGAWTGIDPETKHGALEGLWGGLTGKHYKYTENELADLGLHSLFDPLNFVPSLGLLGKAGKAGKLTKYGEKLYASRAGGLLKEPLGRYFGHAAPGEAGGMLEKAVLAGKATDAPVLRDIDITLGKALKDQEKAWKAAGVKSKDLEDMWLRVGEEFQSGEKPVGILDDTYQAMIKGHQEARTSQLLRDQMREQIGLKPRELLREVEVPRFASLQRKQDATLGRFWRGMGFDEPTKPYSRTVKRWVEDNLDDELIDIGEGGAQVITKPGYQGIKKVGKDQYVYTDPITGAERPVRPVEITLKQGLESGVLKREDYITNPLAAMSEDIGRKRNQISFLRILGNSMEETGGLGQYLRKAEVDEWGQAVIPEGMVSLRNIPGLGEWVAHPVVATRMQNIAQIPLNEKSIFGGIQKAVDVFLKNTEIGRAFRHMTLWYKRMALGPHPGFYLANYISDLSLAYMHGVHPWDMPILAKQAERVQRAKGVGIIPGKTNEELFRVSADRNVIGKASWSGAESGGDALNRAKQWRYYKTLPDKLAKLKLPGRAAGKVVEGVGETGEKAIDWAFNKIGAPTQDNVRVMVFLDYLKKAVKEGEPVTDDLFNAAAAHSHAAMIDYGDLTSFENTLKNFAPFYTWYRGIMGKALTETIGAPQRLARLGRFWDFTFDPLSQRDKAVAPDWIAEKGPVTGIMGMPFNDIWSTENNNPLMLLSGRFNPYGTIEEFVNRPYQSLANMVNPVIKGPKEIVTNWSDFKNRPVDPVAGGFPGSLINPLIGRPYSYANRRVLGVPLPAGWEHLVRQSPPGALLPPAQHLANAISPSTFQDPNLPEINRSQELTSFGLRSKFFQFDRPKQIATKTREFKRKESELRGLLKWASKSQDQWKVDYYEQALRELRERQSKALGFVEGP